MILARRLLHLALLALPFAVLFSCAQPAYVPTNIAGPPLPEAEYRRAARKGIPVYRIDSQRSRIFIRVGRDGPMKSAGHDHVIASEHVDGLVIAGDDPDAARADLRLPVQRLVVDSPEYRARFGLEPGISESAINGTTRNMQDKVLESMTYPWAEMSARFADATDEPKALAVSVTVHGATHEYLVPVELSVNPDTLSVSGTMSLRHGDFGLTPYSAAGGLLRVTEQIDIEFQITGERWTL